MFICSSCCSKMKTLHNFAETSQMANRELLITLRKSVDSTLDFSKHLNQYVKGNIPSKSKINVRVLNDLVNDQDVYSNIKEVRGFFDIFLRINN